MRIRGQGHTIAGAFVFLLLGLFAVSATLMVLLGVRFYRAETEKSEQTGEYRILSAYIRTMVRGLDEEGILGTETVDGIETLTLTENYDGWEYVTRIYTYDGALREWFSEADHPFEPSLGEKIYAADGFHAKIEDDLLKVSLQDSYGREIEVSIAPRSLPAGGGAN